MNRYILPTTCLALLLGAPTTVTAQVPMAGDLGQPVFDLGSSPISKPLTRPAVNDPSILFQHGDPGVYSGTLQASFSGTAVGGTQTRAFTATGQNVELDLLVSDDAMDRSGTDWQVTEIYIATLGYAPDDEGLQYWIENIETLSAWTPTTVAQSFFDQPLVQELYPETAGYDSLIEALYQNIFGRPADATGKVYWLEQLESGAIQRNQMIIALINGGWANPEAVLDMQRFGHRVQVGLAFAAEQAAHSIRYTRLSADDQFTLRNLGAEIIADVTDDASTRDNAIARIPTLLDTYLACADQCRLGEVDGLADCQLWNAEIGEWSDRLDDGQGQLHNRARHHTTWLHNWMLPAGGVMAAQFSDETLRTVLAYGGRRDSAIWTGTYLASEALRLMSTGSPDAERALGETLETLHRWWSISGDPGYLARYAAPADSAESVLALLSTEDSEVHLAVGDDGQPWRWRGNISRDQYQGVILGYSLAYEATQDPALRERIRSDVVAFVEQLMSSERQRVDLTVNGLALPLVVTIPYAVFSQADAPNGTPALTLTTDPFEAAGEGVLFFLPNAADLVRQLPGFSSFPDFYQPTQAIQLGAIFNVALQVTRDVPEYATRRQAIADHYAAHADAWLDIAARWRNTNTCDEGYFGLNIGFMPLYTWTRLETDPSRKGRLQREVLRDGLWAAVADHKNVFFAFLYAALAPEEDDTAGVTEAHVGQLAHFSTAPNLSRPVDLRGVYAESTTCAGISGTAVDVDERPAATFTWERQPWKLVDDGTPNLVYGGVDYLIAYWLGRHYGFIHDDAPGTCLRWRS